METIELKRDIISETFKTLYEGDNMNVKINYYWDSHGDLHRFPFHDKYSETRHAKRVKLEEHTTVERFVKEVELTSWRLYIDDERQPFDVYAYSIVEYDDNTSKMIVKAVVGWG